MGKRVKAQETASEEKLHRKADKERKRKREESSATDSKLTHQEASPAKYTSLLAEEKAAKKARKAEKKAQKLASQQRSTNGHAEEHHSPKSHEQNGDQTARSSVMPAKSENGYVQHPSLAAADESVVDSFVTNNHIKIDDPRKSDLRPIMKFSQLSLKHEGIKEEFAGFKDPTPIQAASWPFLLDGSDLVGIAETGSGKTLAFGVPCIEYVASAVSDKKKARGVKAVIVAPTRELAVQSFEQLSKLASRVGCRAVCIYGGMPKDEQRAGLAKAQIVVATPGRLNDFIQEGAADLSGVGFVVLDEADRMLDKGFEDEVRKIVSATQATGRQMAMFTATWPTSVRELAATFMTSPVKVSIGDHAVGDLRANVRIVQQVEVVDPRAKDQRLLQLLKQYQSGKNRSDRILVFCLYKKEATRTEAFIRSKGFRVAGIHGDLNQIQRTASLEAFRAGTTPLLVATDVAARGLDIPAVRVVINVTFPLTTEDYVHRIGRTGRAGQDGLAITLFTENEKALAGSLINVLKAAKQPVPEALLKFGTTVKKKAHDAYGAFYREPVDDVKATKITFD